ncbi:MAG TPA: hypothetical protein VGI40_23935 [Pirellulaceae bacterium]|jgi:hypothetical protein
MMVYRGQVTGSVIVLADGVRLPEGSEVLVEPIGRQLSPPSSSIKKTRNGVPVFPSVNNGFKPSLELVNKLRDETP